MSNYNKLLDSSSSAVDKYYSGLKNSSDNETKSLDNLDKKNNFLLDKQKINNDLLLEISNKEKLLLTRSRMLQISQDRNSYKMKLVYTLIASAIAISILIIVIYGIIRKRKF
jgi:hypothetical protein